MLAAGRLHVDLWAATQLDAGAAASSVRRRLSAPSSFYRYCAAHDLIGLGSDPGRSAWPVAVSGRHGDCLAWTGTRPAPWSPPLTPTPVPRRCAPRRRGGRCCTTPCASMRPALLDIADLGEDSGHRVLRVVRKGARKAKIPLTLATVAALEAYLAAGRSGPGRGVAAASRAAAGHAHRRKASSGPPVGAGAPPGRRGRDRARGSSSRCTDCAIGNRPSPSMPAPPCATCRTTPGTKIPARPAGTTTPVTAWTATPPIPSLPTWRDGTAGRKAWEHQLEADAYRMLVTWMRSPAAKEARDREALEHDRQSALPRQANSTWLTRSSGPRCRSPSRPPRAPGRRGRPGRRARAGQARPPGPPPTAPRPRPRVRRVMTRLENRVAERFLDAGPAARREVTKVPIPGLTGVVSEDAGGPAGPPDKWGGLTHAY